MTTNHMTLDSPWTLADKSTKKILKREKKELGDSLYLLVLHQIMHRFYTTPVSQAKYLISLLSLREKGNPIVSIYTQNTVSTPIQRIFQ